MGFRWSYCMVGLTMPAPMIACCPFSTRRDFALSCRICEVSVIRHLCRRTQCVLVNIVAMAQDAIDLADALNLQKFAVIGHDWGARIAYALTIAVPQRISRIVTISVGWQPGELPTPSLKQTQAYWYQWFMTTERGRQMVRSIFSRAFSGRIGVRPDGLMTLPSSGQLNHLRIRTGRNHLAFL